MVADVGYLIIQGLLYLKLTDFDLQVFIKEVLMVLCVVLSIAFFIIRYRTLLPKRDIYVAVHLYICKLCVNT